MKPPLCTPCSVARQRWLDYRLPPARGFAHGSGALHDVSEPGIRDGRRARYEQWRSTVRFQMDLIATQCRAGKHIEEQQRPATVVQLDLLRTLDGTYMKGAA